MLQTDFVRKSKYKFYTQFFPKIYETMWKNMVETDRSQMTTDAEKMWFS